MVVTTSFPRWDGDPSGHFVQTAALRLAELGHEVWVVCPGDPKNAPERQGSLHVVSTGGGELFGWPGVASRFREAPWRAVDALGFLRGARAALTTLAHEDWVNPFDPPSRAGIALVEAHWLLPCAWPLAMGIEAPLTAVAHGGDVRLLSRMPAPLRNRILASLIDRGARIRFVSARERERLCAKLDRDLRRRVEGASHVAPCAADVGRAPTPERRLELRRSLGAGLGTHVVVVVARLVPEKRVDLAIRSLALLGRDVLLVVVGDGPERTALEQVARANAVRATFTGLLPRVRCLEIIGSADALLATSPTEGAPTVVREARAFGVPVISTDAGDVSRWSERDVGITVCADKRSLARSLEAAMKEA